MPEYEKGYERAMIGFSPVDNELSFDTAEHVAHLNFAAWFERLSESRERTLLLSRTIVEPASACLVCEIFYLLIVLEIVLILPLSKLFENNKSLLKKYSNLWCY